MYIGSAVNFRRRKNGHHTRLINQNHHSPGLQAAYNKYGWEQLKFEILEVVPATQLRDIEQQYLDAFWSELYNCARNAERPGLGIKPSAATVDKIRQRLLGLVRSLETRDRMSKAQRGKKLSPETRRKISEVQVGRKQSAQTIARRTAKLIGGTHKDNTTGVSGVGKFRGRYRARWRSAHLGVFDTIEQAAQAVNKAREANE